MQPERLSPIVAEGSAIGHEMGKGLALKGRTMAHSRRGMNGGTILERCALEVAGAAEACRSQNP